MRKYTSAHLYQQIREDFFEGKLSYGETLTELGLSNTYHTSRTPLREALIQLEKDGLVERQDNGRIHMLTITKETLHEILELRIMLEQMTLRHALESNKKDDYLNELKKNIDLVDALLAMGHKEKARTELARFHEIAYSYVDLKYTIKIIKNYNLLIHPLRMDTLLNTDRLVSAQEEHKEIYKLMVEQKFQELYNFYNHHLQLSIGKMMEQLPQNVY